MSSRTRPRKTATPPAPQESSLLRWLKERRITEVECLVPDITGNARRVVISIYLLQLLRRDMAMLDDVVNRRFRALVCDLLA